MADVLASRGVGGNVMAGARAAGVHAKAIEIEALSNLASRRSRLLAFAIDIWGVGSVIYLLLTPLRLNSVGLHIGAYTLLWTAYMLFRDRIPGPSIGKRMLGIRVVQMDSGRSCTWASSLWRNMTHFLFGIDALFALGERRMRLGDLIAGTQVVRGPEPRISADDVHQLHSETIGK